MIQTGSSIIIYEIQ